MRVDGTFRAGIPPPVSIGNNGKDSQRTKRSKSRQAQTAAKFTSEYAPVKPLSLRRLVATRRTHRQRTQREIGNVLNVVTLNTQGLDFCRLDSRMKVAALIDQARRHSWHIALLSDTHGRSGPETATILAIEEYFILLSKHTSILLSPEMSREWCASGSKVWRAEGGRSIAIAVTFLDQRYVFVSNYAPHGDTPASAKETFFQDLDCMRQKIKQECTTTKFVMGGDWNAHFGADHGPTAEWHGRFLIRDTKTSKHVGWMENFVSTEGMWHIDSFLPARNRGTWWNTKTSQIYEIDYFVSDIGPRYWRKLTTFACSFGDHFGKQVQLQLAKKSSAFKAKKEDVPKKLNLAAMRGPTVAAINLRQRFSEEVEGRLLQGGGPENELKWDRLARILREEAEKLVGRQKASLVCPWLAAFRKEMVKENNNLRESWERVRKAPNPEAARALRTEHKELRKEVRQKEMQWKAQSVVAIAERMSYEL